MDCPICLTANLDLALICISCGASFISNNSSLLHLPPNTLLKQGKYRIKRILGEGGFGITYSGVDMVSSREIAIKELLPERSSRKGNTFIWTSSVTPRQKQELLEKFKIEAEYLSNCKHPNIVQVYDWFEENDTAYIVMEFAKGEPLSSILKREKTIPEARVKLYLLQLASALKSVHANSLLHRDIKPDNIIITQQGKPILIDFGNAREFIAGKTKKMTSIGTPEYAPLEQNNSVGRFAPAIDIYALSVTAYELLTGKLPDTATNRAMAIVKSKSDTLIPPSRLAPVSPLLEQVILTGIKINADERLQSAQELINALKGSTEAIAYLIYKKQGITISEFALEGRNLIGKFDPDMGSVAIDLEAFSGAETISRRHAEIYREGKQWKIQDLGSTNGVFIKRAGQPRFSGRVTTPQTISTSDEISFGKVTFTFHCY
jgi:serine/threonine protein kinase